MKAGWLARVGPGPFSQAGDTVDWRGSLFALQSQLGLSVHVGARTALELQGRAHFVPLGSMKRILLISDTAEMLPTWFRRRACGKHSEHHVLTMFECNTPEASRSLDCGGFEVVASSLKRALMEQLRLARTNEDFEHALQLMENLATLRPHVVQQLVEACTSIKVNRFFLWSAEQAGHAWNDNLEPQRVDLGAGKRQLYKGGVLDSKYHITAPRQEELPDV